MKKAFGKCRRGPVFVLGDNRDEGASKDSRYFGCISIKSIKRYNRI